jgi:hypothetical protein
MRTFQDETGATWVASVRKRKDDDYKGRFCFVMAQEGGESSREVGLEDVCWNSEKTARRTLLTMSETELRRRLRSAAGRDNRA